MVQVRTRDGQVIIQQMDAQVLPPGTIIKTKDAGRFRVLPGQPDVEQVDSGMGPRWTTIVLVEPAAADVAAQPQQSRPVQQQHQGRRNAVRG